MRYDEDYVAGLKARISELEAKRRKCIVKDCENHADQGAFTGDLCNPCHAFITEGSGFHSQAYRNAKREWVGLTDEDGIEYPYPPAKPPIYATANNTKAVRDGFEMGGYEKEAGYYSEAQLDEFAQAIEAKLKEKNT